MQKILVAGATGMLGSRIAHHLLEQPEVQVRLLLRPDTNATKKNALIECGADIVTGDLTDRDSLDHATQGVDVIVSALQGSPDVMIAGQVALAEAGKRNGVRRILPSDFALDFFKATPGEHMLFDLRRTASEAVAKTGLEAAVVELAMPAPERVIPPKGATPMPRLTAEQMRRYGMDNVPGPNPRFAQTSYRINAP